MYFTTLPNFFYACVKSLSDFHFIHTHTWKYPSFFFFFSRESVLNSNAGFLLAVDLVDWSLRSSSNLQQLEVWPSAACTSQCSLGATGLERKCSICLSHHCRPAIFTRNVSANTLVFCWAQCWHNRKVFYPSGSVPGHELHCLSTLFFAANN